MRLPRDLTGAELIGLLDKLSYRQTRQTGSHVRLTCVDLHIKEYGHFRMVDFEGPLVV